MDADEECLASLNGYQQQLQLVENALNTCDDEEQREDLLTLKSNLIEVIQLSKQSIGIVEANSNVEQHTNNGSTSNDSYCDMDIEYMKFQSEMAELSAGIEEKDDSTVKEESNLDDKLLETITKLEGSKCRAPFSRQWGEKDYHNAIILSVEVENLELLEELTVKVLFCNPLCDAMKPCPYFMDGRCRFSDDKCRFSHGHSVKLSELKEFINPDFSGLERDSLCLAKYSNDLWCKARIENYVENHKYLVKFLQYDDTQTVDIENILPYSETKTGDTEFQENSDSSSDSLEMENSVKDSTNWRPTDPTAREFGEWEKHTKGFGSRIMAQMGYVWGQGLGKNGEGRMEPIEAEVLPVGKSLDKCMELREASKNKNCFSIIKRMKKFQKKREEAIAKGYKKAVPKKESVFDFINQKIGTSRESRENPKVTLSKNAELIKSSKNLNVHSLKISEDIKKAERDLVHLQQAFNRNKERKDKIMQQQLERRIEIQRNNILSLKEQEKVLRKEQKIRKDYDKLTIF